VATLEPTGRARTADGIDVAYFDLGGPGQPLLLAHATGFCGAVLAPLASRLAGRFRCILVDARAHGSSDRPPREDFGWYGFAADVLAVVDELGFGELCGFGHSCGGAALLLAEESRPGTFSALYCYEPIVFPLDNPLAPSLEGNPLSAGAARRREVFGSREEALANFSAKAPFNILPEEVLVAYVDNGFGPDPHGIRLRCRRLDEAQVYAHSLAHDAFAHLDRIRCPVTLAAGALTDSIGADQLDLMAKRLVHGRVEVFAHLGHFGPLEDPDAVARAVETGLDRAQPDRAESDGAGGVDPRPVDRSDTPPA
jgi:pimeloyl-ACP methyl ester carboxylesterase